MAAFNLLDQLTFYGSYHSNKWNQLIHLIFVPTILWTMLVWLANTGVTLASQPLATLSLGPSISLPVVLNLPFLIISAYTLFYLTLDPVAGLSWSACIGVPLWLTSTAFAGEVDKANLWAILPFVLGWYMQIHPGHGILERRKPALMDSFVQAFATAPLFVWYEVLFFFGYRPKLYKELQNRVGKEIAAFRKAQAAKRRVA